MAKKIHVSGKEINIRKAEKGDFISLTDMIKGHRDSGFIIRNGLRGRPTLEFLYLWEQMNNPNFNSVGADSFINENVGSNTFSPSVKDWMTVANAIGIYAENKEKWVKSN